MSDLISRQAVIDIIQEELALRCGYDADIALFSVKKCVSELPTAYDVSKVVADIQAFAECNEECKKNFYYGQGCSACVWNKIMEIVRKGGVE